MIINKLGPMQLLNNGLVINSRKSRLSIKSIKLLVLFFCLWPPACMREIIPHGYSIENLLALLAFTFIVFTNVHKYRQSKLTIVLVVFEIWMIIDTMFHGYDTRSIIADAFKNIGICFLTEKEIRLNEDRYLRNFMLYTSTLLIVNFATIILFENGLWTTEYTSVGRYYFLGYENNIILTVFPLLIIILYFKGSLKAVSLYNWIGLTCGIVSVFVREVATGMLMILVMICIYILSNCGFLRYLLNKWMIILGTIVVFVLIVLVGIQKQFADLIYQLLKKDVTFTYRTYIWDAAIFHIKKSLLIGYGCEPKEMLLNKLNLLSTRQITYAVHAHNLYLDILYKGGIIAFAIWFLYIIISFKNLQSKYKTKSLLILYGGILSYFIAFMVEPYPYMLQLFYFIVSVMYANANMTERGKCED